MKIQFGRYSILKGQAAAQAGSLQAPQERGR